MKDELKNQILNQNETKYGEFVTSYFTWVPLSKQKENAEKLENVTKNKEKRDIKRKNKNKR